MHPRLSGVGDDCGETDELHRMITVRALKFRDHNFHRTLKMPPRRDRRQERSGTTIGDSSGGGPRHIRRGRKHPRPVSTSVDIALIEDEFDSRFVPASCRIASGPGPWVGVVMSASDPELEVTCRSVSRRE